MSDILLKNPSKDVREFLLKKQLEMKIQKNGQFSLSQTLEKIVKEHKDYATLIKR